MLQFSKYFKNDTVDTKQKISPIIVITDTNNNIEFVLSQNQDTIFDNDGNKLDIINCLDRISNIKSSNDYDSKKLKINRLRCTLYNYYDVNTKLTNYINTNIISKLVHVFYKSPTTNVINFDDDINDYDCAKVYIGEISRLKYDDKKISFTAEDRTQIKIGDKQVPYNTTDMVLTPEEQNSIFQNYGSDPLVMPMVFGCVDKTPLIPVAIDNQDRYCKFFIDTQPTFGNFKTAKMPSLLDVLPSGNTNFYIYSKEAEDYLILDHMSHTVNYQNQEKSHVKISNHEEVESYLFDDIGYGNWRTSTNWSFVGYQQRMPKSFFHGDVSFFRTYHTQLSELQILPNAQGEEFILNSQNRYVYYRDTDTIINDGYFDTGLKQINTNDGFETQFMGRYLLISFEKALGDILVQVRNTDSNEFIGNTFLACDWKMYTSNDGTVNPNNTAMNTLEPTMNKIGWFVYPIFQDKANAISSMPDSLDVDSNAHYISLRVEDGSNNATYRKDDSFRNTIMHWLLARNDDEESTFAPISTGIVESGTGNEIETFGPDPAPESENIIDNNNPYAKCPIKCDINEESFMTCNFYGTRGSAIIGQDRHPIWTPIQGKYYGDDTEIQEQQDIDKILIHESKLSFGNTSHENNTMTSGLQLSGMGLIHALQIEDIRTKKLFGSVKGRKNHTFTEQIDAESYQSYLSITDDISYEQALLLDPDAVNEDSEQLLNGFANAMLEIVDNVIPYEDSNGNVIIYTKEELGLIFEPSSYQEIVQAAIVNNMQGLHSSPFYNSYYMLTDLLMKSFLRVVNIIHNGDGHRDASAEFSGNVSSEIIQLINSNIEIKYNIDPLLQPTAYNHRCLFTEHFLKSFGKLIYRYIFNNENFGNWDYDFSFTYRTINMDNWENALSVYHVNLNNLAETDTAHGYTPDNLPPDVAVSGTPHLVNVNYIDPFNHSYAGNLTFSEIPMSEIDSFEEIFINLPTYLDHIIQNFDGNFDTSFDEIRNDTGTLVGYYTFHEGDAYQSLYASSAVFFTQLDLSGTHYLGEFRPTPYFSTLIESNLYSFDPIINEIITIYNSHLQGEALTLTTNGLIEKPTDIIMNILVNEMHFGKANNELVGMPDYSKFDIESIQESRQAHNNFKMSFSLNRKTSGKRLIEDICKESKSYPKFNMDGTFGFLTIKDSYTYEDIDVILDLDDIIKYNFDQTKREDIYTEVDAFFRFDNGFNRYEETKTMSINELLPEYELTAYENYNIIPEDVRKTINLKYHSDHNTVNNFLKYSLLNNCNVHNVINAELTLNYCNLQIGDILHIPLINNDFAFNIDYSIVSYVNSQPVYPLWIIMETDLGINSMKIKAVQLHYLGIDGNHGFVMPEQENYEIIGNMQQYNTYYEGLGLQVPNYNYNPNATTDNGIEIPYYDLNNDGIINVVDIISVVNHVLGTETLSISDQNKLKLNNDTINVVTIVEMINIILAN